MTRDLLAETSPDHVDRDSRQSDCLVPRRASSDNIGPPRTGDRSKEVNNSGIGPVLLRWTRNSDLHAIAMETDNGGLACIGYHQQIDLDAGWGISYRGSLHGTKVMRSRRPTVTTILTRFDRDARPCAMDTSDRRWCEAGSIIGRSSPWSHGKNPQGSRTRRPPTTLVQRAAGVCRQAGWYRGSPVPAPNGDEIEDIL